MKRFLACGLVLATATAALTACDSLDSDVADHNITKEVGMFRVNRRIVFYNGITGEYILTIEGLCALGAYSRQLTVTCKTGPNEYKRHALGLSDNVTYFVEQVDAANVSVYHYKVVFKPSVIIPDIEVR